MIIERSEKKVKDKKYVFVDKSQVGFAENDGRRIYVYLKNFTDDGEYESFYLSSMEEVEKFFAALSGKLDIDNFEGGEEDGDDDKCC